MNGKGFFTAPHRLQMPVLLLVLFLLISVIFIIEVSVPFGIASGTMYLLVVFFSWMFPKKSAPFYIAALCMTMILFRAYMLYDEGYRQAFIYINRGFSIATLWITAFLLSVVKRASLKTQHSKSELEELVSQRTAELEEKINESKRKQKLLLDSEGALVNLMVELKESEQKFRDLLESAPDAMVIVNQQGKITLVNRQTENLFGFTTNELIDQPAEILMPSRFRNNAQEFRKVFLKNPEFRKSHAVIEFKGITKAGIEFPVEISFNMFEKGDLVLAAIRDISDRKRAEKGLTEAASIIDSTDDAIINLTLNEIITRWNKGAEKLYGYTPSEATGKSISIIIPPEMRDEETTIFQKIKEGIPVKNYETKRLRKDGTLVDISLTVSPVVASSGKVIGISKISRDITEKKKAEERLQFTQYSVDHAADAIFWVNEKGKFFYVNEEAANLFQYSKKELLNMSIFDLEANPGSEKNWQKFWDEMREKGHMILESRVRKKDGTVFPMEVNTTFFKYKGRELKITHGRDISERKAAEEQFKELLESAPDAMVIVDRKGVIKLINLQTEKFFGYARNELIGKPVELLIPERFRENHPQHRGNYFLNPHIRAMGSDLELYGLKNDGTEFPVEISLSPLHKQGLVSAAIRDITDRKHAEEKFKAVVNAANDAIITASEDGNILAWNPGAERIFGWKSAEVIGKPLELIMPEKYRAMHRAGLKRFIETGIPKVIGKTVELEGLRNDQSVFPIEISLNAWKANGEWYFSGILRDISERKLAEENLLKSKTELQALSEKLSQHNKQLASFAHIASHNLRAPVGNLSVLLDYFNQSDDPEEKAVIWKKFERVISHLSNTLNQLTEMLKIKEDTEKEREIILFEDVFSKIREMLSAQIMQYKAEVTSDFSEAPNILYPLSYVESIFLNLLSNALKYRSPERALKVHFKTASNNGQIMLKVNDNGIGINLKKHGDKLFGLHKVFTRHPEARGVGLFLVKTQVEAMGGTIFAESEVNNGTTFHILFNKHADQ